MKTYIKESKDYVITCCGKVFNSKNRRMSTTVNQSGYEQLGIRMTDGSRKWFVVHRLVALHFIPNPENKPHINHIDGNKLNNDISNLEWCTPKENMQHAAKVLKRGVGENNPNRIINESTVHTICKLMEQGITNWEIADTLEITLGIVTSIRSKNSWKYIADQYIIPKKSCILSESTIRWICSKIAENLSTRQILDLSDNPRITKSILSCIRRKRLYRDISKDYF